MKRSAVVLLFTLAAVPFLHSQDKAPKDKVSYSVGASIGKNLKMQGFTLDIESVVAGLKDAFAGTPLKMSEEEIRDTMMSFQKAAMMHQMEAAKKAGEKAKKDGEEFLAANKKKDSVVTLPDGLQYKVIKQGEGKKPTLEDTVTVNYRGSFVDGTEFDSSFKHGKPTTLPLSQFVKGWGEGLQLMSPGAKYQLVIPSDLAYGERGMQGVIPPNSTLVFEVELISFK